MKVKLTKNVLDLGNKDDILEGNFQNLIDRNAAELVIEEPKKEVSKSKKQ